VGDITVFNGSSYIAARDGSGVVLGVPGATGADWYLLAARGASAYDIAVSNGFVGTESEWLTSIEGAISPGEFAAGQTGSTVGSLLFSSTTGPSNSVEVMTATSASGKSLVTAAVTISLTPDTGLSEGPTGTYAIGRVECGFTGEDVTSSRPILRLDSSPSGMAQMVIFAEVNEGATAVLECEATLDTLQGVDGPWARFDIRWDGALGIGANTAASQNNFQPSLNDAP
jgi:hypothetical protein